jgi:phage shock protein PspC (stress-responsive transcriptional regulator)
MPSGFALGNDGAVTSTVGTRRPLFRDTQHAVVGGVASGLAAHLGLQHKSSRWLLRLAFVVLAFAQGFGVVLYAAFWIILPPDPDQAEPRRRLWLRVMVAVFAAPSSASWPTPSPATTSSRSCSRCSARR